MEEFHRINRYISYIILNYIVMAKCYTSRNENAVIKENRILCIQIQNINKVLCIHVITNILHIYYDKIFVPECFY